MSLSELQVMNAWASVLTGYKSTGERIFNFARAIESEVRKDDEALIRQMLEHLEVVTDAGPDGEGWQSQDLKNTIAAATARLEKAP